MTPNPPGRTRALHLLDLVALTIGYGLASLLVRAFWPSGEAPAPVQVAAIGLVYAWIGLAMSGPIVLAIRRRPSADDPGPPDPRTWAELAWLIIGFYWIGLTALLVPIRMAQAPLRDATVLSIFPILAALGLRLFGPVPRRANPPWTHRAAVGLLLAWPVAWVALILLGKTLL